MSAARAQTTPRGRGFNDAELAQRLRNGDLEVAIRASLSAEHRDATGIGMPDRSLGLFLRTLQLARATADHAESDAILEAGVRAALRLANRTSAYVAPMFADETP